jgi:hypothetical protein
MLCSSAEPASHINTHDLIFKHEPQSAIRRNLLKQLPYLILLSVGEKRESAFVLFPLIGKDLWPILVVAARQYSNPVRTIVCD